MSSTSEERRFESNIYFFLTSNYVGRLLFGDDRHMRKQLALAALTTGVICDCRQDSQTRRPKHRFVGRGRFISGLTLSPGTSSGSFLLLSLFRRV